MRAISAAPKPSGAASKTASGPVLTEAQTRNRLKNYLQQQFPNDPTKIDAALALFDAQHTKDVIPAPTLRAALVGMKGRRHGGSLRLRGVDRPLAGRRDGRRLWVRFIR